MSTVHERADDYVLGLLDPSEHERVTAALENDADLRAAVAASRDRFLELDMTARPESVSPDLWGRIEAGLSAKADARGAIAPRPANDNAAGFWRLSALAGLAASIMLVVALGWSVITRPAPQVVAVLLDAGGTPLALVEDFGNASARVTPLVDFDVPAGKTMQVWTLPSKEMGPVSLGLLPSSHAAVLAGPTLPAPHEDQLYEITIEQAGGSPTGRPTGPILVKGLAKVPR